MKRHITRLMQELPGFGTGSERRRAGRIRCTGLRSSIGQVVDLSSGGVRVELYPGARPQPGDAVLLRLTGSCGTEFEVTAHVVDVATHRTTTGLGRWLGRHRSLARLSFDRLTDAAGAAVWGLARTHSDTKPAR